MVLSDESAEKALLIQLVDRGVISSETLQERFGEIPEIEKIRGRREDKAREKGSMSNKAGPWHNPEKDHDLAKIAMQRGIVTPSEVGLDLNDRKDGETTPQEDMKDASKQRFSGPEQNKGEPQQGRPKNSKDTEQRKTRTPKPQTVADIDDFIGTSMWAKAAQSQISTIITPAMLDHFGKKNLRSLSAKETETLETFKFSILCSLDPHSQIDEKSILNLAQSGKVSVPNGSFELYNKLVGKFVASHGRRPSVDDLRDIQVSVYSIIKK